MTNESLKNEAKANETRGVAPERGNTERGSTDPLATATRDRSRYRYRSRCGRWWLLIVAIVLVATPQATRGEEPEPSDEVTQQEFRPLFNGRDLTGWVLVNTPPETWTVEDGMLICSGKPIGEMRTDRMYQNFILELEWRHMVPRGNSGVFVWADDLTARGVPFHRAIEVQVLENAYGNTRNYTTHGDIFPIHGARMTPINGRGGSRAFPTEERSRPSPEWNHYRIVCNDGSISLAVNGKVVTRGKDASPRKGYICLESEGGVVHFRNIQIHELPDTPIDPEDIATKDRGYRSLYTGLNLSGWNLEDVEQTSWEVRDWILAFTDDDPSHATLSSTETFGDFGFVFDMRPGDDFQSLDVLFTDGQQGLTLTPDDSRWGAHFRARDWNRWEGVLKDRQLSLHLNGQPVVTGHPVEGEPGSWTFRPKGKLQMANLFVRSVSDDDAEE